MKKFLLLFLLLLLNATSFSQSKPIPPSKSPKLVVGIVVDQMRPEYITRFWNKFGNDGFKRLINEGYNCRNTQYNYVPTYTGPGHTSIYTGTTPMYHGIIGNDWYDSKYRDSVYCAGDTSVKAVGFDSKAGKMSPWRLLTTTITDELHLATQGKSKVIGISLKDRGAILPAGRAADAAYWYDASGNWISSTWYKSLEVTPGNFKLPQWAIDFNSRKLPEQYLSKPWTTLLPIETYTESDVDTSRYEAAYRGEEKPAFPHNLPALRGTSFDILRRVPFGNTLSKDFALAAIKGENMGADSITDFLCLSFSATDYVGHQFAPMSIETEDTYLRLDRDLADLLKFLDANVGKGKYLLFLTADHAAVNNPQSLIDQKMMAGFADDSLIEVDIKSFLKNNYKDTSYLKRFMNDEIYLDREKIASADTIDICKMENEIAAYLKVRIDGLLDVMTACDLQHSEYKEPFRNKKQRGYQVQRSGEVWLMFAPGWTSHLFGNGKQGTTHGSPYPYDSQVPLLWYGWNIPHGETTKEFHITDIAPTLSYLLHVGVPNGCTGTPIIELTK